MRTIVVSDLHLGTRGARDVLRRPGPLAALAAAVEGADRLVLLGDVLELRHGPLREALGAATPVLAALAGLVILRQPLTAPDLLAMVLVVAASMGAVRAASRRSRTPITEVTP